MDAVPILFVLAVLGIAFVSAFPERRRSIVLSIALVLAVLIAVPAVSCVHQLVTWRSLHVLSQSLIAPGEVSVYPRELRHFRGRSRGFTEHFYYPEYVPGRGERRLRFDVTSAHVDPTTVNLKTRRPRSPRHP